MKYKILILLFIVGFVSCKKSTPVDVNPTIIPSNATSYYGIFNAGHFQNISSSNPSQISENAYAYFSITPTKYFSQSCLKVNSVSLNGVKFYFYSPLFYEDTTMAINLPPNMWQISGLGIIPSFTFVNYNPMPTYTNYSLLPNSINRNQSTTIPITGVTGADQVTVQINTGSIFAVQTLTAGATSVTFPSSSLSSLDSSNYATISVLCVKNNVQSVGGLPMNFQTSFGLQRTIIIH